MHPVTRGDAPGEQAAVGGQCQRRYRVGGFEENRLAREAIEIRRQPARRSVRPQAIGAKCVERDDDEVEGRAVNASRQPPYPSACRPERTAWGSEDDDAERGEGCGDERSAG